MKILLCHNFYRQPGGEDQVYRDEGWLLEQFGHEVVRYEMDNHSIDDYRALRLARITMWNRDAYKEIGELLRLHRPDIVHFHNTFPLISPSGYHAARRGGVPVVQSLHSFRTICPGATLLRNGAICEKCIRKRFAWPAVVHKCYRDDRRASFITAASNAFHHLRGTWQSCVNRYIALTNHSREKFVSGGLSPSKVCVKPNFVRPDPGLIESTNSNAVFVGRLATEKGIDTLLAAWEKIDRNITLKLIGDGPLREKVQRAQETNPNISWLGQLPFEEVLQQIGQARILICPSIWYETFGRSMIEAFATGTPVIVSDIGSMKELVTDGETGLHFRVGDPQDLAEKVVRFFDNPQFFLQACRAARQEYEQKYTPETNYQILMDIYTQAISDFADNEACR